LSLRHESPLPRKLVPRAAVAAVLVAALAAYEALADRLPAQATEWDAALVSLVLMPATFGLVLLALVLRRARGLAAVGLAFGVLAGTLVVADLDVAANFAKLTAVTALGFGFLSYFERLSWVVLVAAVIPIVDTLSVWRGPTRKIVEDQPEAFGVLSIAFPLPADGSFQLGLPDFLFFALFLAAAQRWNLRVLPTWVAMVASFGLTLALTIWVDPFDLGGLPALPLLAVAFLAVNADLLVRRMRLHSEVYEGVD